ncbi:hypothetical protein, partial [Corynebacterium bovis]|uniref:hypothetical protein n=1 Tax=Corynebacterium bovis TaxID=36808 RepID=UPI000FA1108A
MVTDFVIDQPPLGREFVEPPGVALADDGTVLHDDDPAAALPVEGGGDGALHGRVGRARERPHRLRDTRGRALRHRRHRVRDGGAGG